MNILIICVNYNSYDQLNEYMYSIYESWKLLRSNINLRIVIADNSSNKKTFKFKEFEGFKITILDFPNLGYFGAVQKVINQDNDINKFDYIVISNVDLKISSDFFSELKNQVFSPKIGWLAPSIFSLSENRDKNPKIINRPSKRKIKILKTMYRFPFLHRLYETTLYKRKLIRKEYGEMDIYAGHGSFIILTKQFFNKIGKIDYPIFLFGEEQYLGEMLRRANLKVRYIPSLKIYDTEHASTGNIRRKSYYKYNFEAQSYILKNYYE